MEIKLSNKIADLKLLLVAYCTKLLKVYAKIEHNKQYALDEELLDLEISFSEKLFVNKKDLLKNLINEVCHFATVQALIDIIEKLENELFKISQKNKDLFNYFDEKYLIDPTPPF